MFKIACYILRYIEKYRYCILFINNYMYQVKCITYSINSIHFSGFLIYFGYGIWHSKEGKRGNFENESESESEGQPVDKASEAGKTRRHFTYI